MNFLKRIFHIHNWVELRTYKNRNGTWMQVDKCKTCGKETEYSSWPWYCKGGDWW